MVNDQLFALRISHCGQHERIRVVFQCGLTGEVLEGDMASHKMWEMRTLVDYSQIGGWEGSDRRLIATVRSAGFNYSKLARSPARALFIPKTGHSTDEMAFLC